jgi:hypothetical protein
MEKGLPTFGATIANLQGTEYRKSTYDARLKYLEIDQMQLGIETRLTNGRDARASKRKLQNALNF